MCLGNAGGTEKRSHVVEHCFNRATTDKRKQKKHKGSRATARLKKDKLKEEEEGKIGYADFINAICKCTPEAIETLFESIIMKFFVASGLSVGNSLDYMGKM